jgi:hypothetical protein
MTAKSREVLFLIDAHDRVLWSDESSSPVLLPDRRERWEAIWTHRHALAEIAHSHPVGPLAFSQEDETTMAALIEALGFKPTFSVVAPGGMIRRGQDGHTAAVAPEPAWASELRARSGMSNEGG